MNRLLRSALRPVSIFFGVIPVTLCGLYIAFWVLAAIRRGQWPSVAEDAATISLDPLQTLAFVLAWTGFVGAITVGVSNRVRDVARNFEEALRLAHETRAIHERLRSIRRISDAKFLCNPCRLSSRSKIIPFVVTFLQFTARQAQRWYAWIYFFWAVSFCILRLRWALTQVDVPAVVNGITVLSVPATIAWTSLWWWSIAVVALTERTVHVWRWLISDSERILETAKEQNNRANDLERTTQQSCDGQ